MGYSIPLPPPFRSVHDVAGGLLELEDALVEMKDPRGVFVTAYLVITQTLRTWIDRKAFLENEATANYVVAFANAYRRALARYEAGTPPAAPKAWRQSFDACSSRDASLFQQLMLGINAHINHDLPYVIIKAGIDVESERCYRDHSKIDEALNLAVPIVRQRIAARHRRSLRLYNCLYGRAVDAAVSEAFQRARRHAWNLARALHRAKERDERQRVGLTIGDRAALAGRIILANRNAPSKCIATLYDVDQFMRTPMPA